jgi:hypothetical protein
MRGALLAALGWLAGCSDATSDRRAPGAPVT